MSNYSDKDIQILEHIIKYCFRIEKTLNRFGKEFDAFLADNDFRDSVSMNLLQIGEFAGKLTDDYSRSTMSDMNWRAIKSMRNMFAHDYGSMDIDTIWKTATEDIPVLHEFCDSEVTRLETSDIDEDEDFIPSM